MDTPSYCRAQLPRIASASSRANGQAIHKMLVRRRLHDKYRLGLRLTLTVAWESLPKIGPTVLRRPAERLGPRKAQVRGAEQHCEHLLRLP